MKSISLLTLLSVLGPFSLSAGGAETYPRPELLIEPAQLAHPQAAKSLVVLDARGQKDYDKGHVPGAVWIDADGWKKAFGDGRDTAGWGKRIGQAGIGQGATVVVYDEKKSVDAARMWWILRYWGVADVRLLNGGWKGYTAAKLPTSTKVAASPMPTALVALWSMPVSGRRPEPGGTSGFR